MAYGTIKEHGGTPEIESVEGQGTIIRIILPAHIAASAEHTANDHAH